MPVGVLLITLSKVIDGDTAHLLAQRRKKILAFVTYRVKLVTMMELANVVPHVLVNIIFLVVFVIRMLTSANVQRQKILVGKVFSAISLRESVVDVSDNTVVAQKKIPVTLGKGIVITTKIANKD